MRRYPMTNSLNWATWRSGEVKCPRIQISPPPLFSMVHLAEEGDEHCCSHCKSCHVDIYKDKGKKMQSCLDCGFEEVLK